MQSTEKTEEKHEHNAFRTAERFYKLKAPPPRGENKRRKMHGLPTLPRKPPPMDMTNVFDFRFVATASEANRARIIQRPITRDISADAPEHFLLSPAAQAFEIQGVPGDTKIFSVLSLTFILQAFTFYRKQFLLSPNFTGQG